LSWCPGDARVVAIQKCMFITLINHTLDRIYVISFQRAGVSSGANFRVPEAGA
jgi:hypothetical protein